MFVAIRFALAAFPAVLLVGRPRVGVKWVIAVGFFIAVGQFGLLFLGIHEGMPAGLSSLVIQLQAVFTVALAVTVLGERPTSAQLMGVLIAFAGLGLLVFGRAENVSWFPFLLVVGAAASWGAANICTRLAKPSDGFALLVWSSLVGPIPLAILSVLIDGPDSIGHAATSINWQALLALFYIVVPATLFGWGAWTWLLARHPASSVAPFALLAPVAALLSTWLLRDERPGALELLGGAVILIGLALTLPTPVRLRIWQREGSAEGV